MLYSMIARRSAVYRGGGSKIVKGAGAPKTCKTLLANAGCRNKKVGNGVRSSGGIKNLWWYIDE